MPTPVNEFDTPDSDPQSRRRLGILGGAAAVLLVAVGLVYLSGRPTVPEFGVVSGVVTLDGRTLPEVEVIILPDPEQGGRGPEARGSTDKDGRYRVETQRWDHDGAVVGVHRIVVRDETVLPARATRGRSVRPGGRPPRAARADAPPPPPGPKVSRIPAIYESVASTPLRPLEVKPGEQVHDIALTSKPGR